MLSKMILFLSVIYIVIIVCPGFAAIDSKSIVAIWLCDEGQGTTVGDASGHGHDGKIVGDVKWADGKFGKALEFLGKGGTRVEIPDDDSLTMEAWTITAWVKLQPPPGGDWAIIVVKDPGNGVQTYALDLNKGGEVNAEVSSGGSWSSCQATTPVYDKVWHFLAASYDKTTLRVYVDGKKEGEQIFNKGDVNTAPVTIGGRMDSSQPLLGLVDDIGMFNTALSVDDLKSIMDKGVGKVTGLSAVEPSSKLATTWGQLKL